MKFLTLGQPLDPEDQKRLDAAKAGRSGVSAEKLEEAGNELKRVAAEKAAKCGNLVEFRRIGAVLEALDDTDHTDEGLGDLLNAFAQISEILDGKSVAVLDMEPDELEGKLSSFIQSVQIYMRLSSMGDQFNAVLNETIKKEGEKEDSPSAIIRRANAEEARKRATEGL